MRRALASRRILGALLVAVLGLGVVLLTEGAPMKATGPPARYLGRIGMSSHLIGSNESKIYDELLPLKAAGIDWIREDIDWGLTEPEKGTFDWTRPDRLMAAASRAGIKVLGIIDYSAPWASSDPSGAGASHYPPKDPQDFANYAAAVARRYGSSGTFWASHPKLPKVPLGAVELWNEPFGWRYWEPTPDPTAYARLVDAAAPAIHAAAPGLAVLASGDLMQSRADGAAGQWIGELLNADPALPAEVDGFSVHPYPWPRNAGPYDPAMNPLVSFGRVAAVRATELAHGTRLPIWITEIGWSTASGVSDAVSEATQARFLIGAVQRATGEWRAFVRRIFLFSWDRGSDKPGDSEGNYSIRHADGSAKPAWTALKQLLASRGS